MFNPELGINLSGFTFCKNALKLSYPIKATIDSLLYYCDEIIVNVGISEDDTVKYLTDLYGTNPKVKMFVREWPGKDKGTSFYRDETNFALSQCQGQFCLYAQGDEVLHEDDKDILLAELDEIRQDPTILGLTNRFIHVEGDFNSLRGAYQFECRVFKNTDQIESWGDAQSFKIKGTMDNFLWKYRIVDTGKTVAPISNVRVFHYGFVRPPKAMFEKTWAMDEYYNQGERLKELQTNMDKSCPDKTWKYGHWNAMQFHGTHPIFAKDYIRQYENMFPELIRYSARFADDPIKPYRKVDNI